MNDLNNYLSSRPDPCKWELERVKSLLKKFGDDDTFTSLVYTISQDMDQIHTDIRFNVLQKLMSQYMKQESEEKTKESLTAALQIACRGIYSEKIIDLLLESGADANQKNAQGLTPLAIVVQTHPNTAARARPLLKSMTIDSINQEITDDDGDTKYTLDLSVESWDTETVKLFIGCDKVNEFSDWVLEKIAYVALETRDFDLIDLYLKMGHTLVPNDELGYHIFRSRFLYLVTHTYRLFGSLQTIIPPNVVLNDVLSEIIGYSEDIPKMKFIRSVLEHREADILKMEQIYDREYARKGLPNMKH